MSKLKTLITLHDQFSKEPVRSCNIASPTQNVGEICVGIRCQQCIFSRRAAPRLHTDTIKELIIKELDT